MPLVVNLSDGRTETFDLETDVDATSWAALKAHSPASIRAVSIKVEAVLHVLPLPKDAFSSLRWDGELIYHRDGTGKIVGERVTLYADGLAASILAYRGRRPQMVRYTLEKSGTPVFIPEQPKE